MSTGQTLRVCGAALSDPYVHDNLGDNGVRLTSPVVWRCANFRAFPKTPLVKIYVLHSRAEAPEAGALTPDMADGARIHHARQCASNYRAKPQCSLAASFFVAIFFAYYSNGMPSCIYKVVGWK